MLLIFCQLFLKTSDSILSTILVAEFRMFFFVNMIGTVLVAKCVYSKYLTVAATYLVGKVLFRTEDLISYRSLVWDFDFTGVSIKQAHSKLRNCFIGASV